MAELAATHDVAIEWLAYELRPEPAPLPDITGPGGERFRQNWERGVAPMAAKLGVEMHFPPFKSRSRQAHEAALYARDHDLFESMRVALFRAFFVENRDIGEMDTLVAIGASVGLDAGSMRAALVEGQYTDQVIAQEQLAAQVGISAVPTIVIGQVGVQGAQPYDVLRRVYDEARRRMEEATE
ncbi:MAG: DsbA family protein [Chloroflexota bacterium]|nr:DsbA family protein [Chloroflexota bacterium]